MQFQDTHAGRAPDGIAERMTDGAAGRRDEASRARQRTDTCRERLLARRGGAAQLARMQNRARPRPCERLPIRPEPRRKAETPKQLSCIESARRPRAMRPRRTPRGAKRLLTMGSNGAAAHLTVRGSRRERPCRMTAPETAVPGGRRSSPSSPGFLSRTRQSRALPTLLAGLALAAAMFFITPGSVHAGALVSNLDASRGDNDVTGRNRHRATSFGTGGNPGGYTVTDVQAPISRILSILLEPLTTTVTIRPDSSGSPDPDDDNIVATLTNPEPFTAHSINTFTAPTGTKLDPNKTYWLVVNDGTPEDDRLNFRTTNSTGTGFAGWSIETNRVFSSDSIPPQWGSATRTSFLRMAINGSAIGNRAPTVATEILDQTATAGEPFSFQIPENTFADADNNTLSYTATKADGADLPAWLSFNVDTRTISGRFASTDITIKVTANDGNGGSVSDEFEILVLAPTSPADCDPTDPNEIWCALLTPDSTPASLEQVWLGYCGENQGGFWSLEWCPIGLLSDRSFEVEEGTSYTVKGLFAYRSDFSSVGIEFEQPLPVAVWPQLTLQIGSSTFAFGQAGVPTPQPSDRSSNFFDWRGGNNPVVIERGTNVTVKLIRMPNSPPAVANPIPVQVATVGTAFTYQFPRNTFIDPDNEPLTYGTNPDLLPEGVSLNTHTRTFSWWPRAPGRYTVGVNAYDGNGWFAADSFDIVVNRDPQMLVSNLNVHPLKAVTPHQYGVNSTHRTVYAQKFTTGANRGGYKLGSVVFKPGDDITSGSDNPRISIYTADDSGNPGRSLHELGEPVSVDSSPYVSLAAPENATLSRKTDYFVVFEATSGSFRVNLDADGDEDAGGASGWSISDSSHGKRGDGNWRAVSGAATIAIRGTPNLSTTNTPATGAPAITGEASVGGILTATTDGITDTDGIANVRWGYQWIRVDADGTANATDIDGATSASYAPTETDVGKRLKVRVTFTDDAGNGEELTSPAYPASGTVAARSAAPPGSVGGGALVSNLDASRGDSDVTGRNRHRATSFGTGGNAGGYTVTDVQAPISRILSILLEPLTTTVTIRPDSSGSPDPDDDNIVATLTNPEPFTAHSINTFTAPTGTKLDPNKTYWLVVNDGTPEDDRLNFRTTNSTGTGFAGWSIETNRVFSSDSIPPQWGSATRTSFLRMAINGSAIGNRAPTVATAIPDQTATAGEAFSFQIPENTFADADNNTLSYTATNADGTDLPAWLSLNGDTGEFSGTPGNADQGAIAIEVTAHDGNNGSVTASFVLRVNASASTAGCDAGDPNEIWCATLSPGVPADQTHPVGWCRVQCGNKPLGPFGLLSDHSFEIEGTTYNVESLRGGRTGGENNTRYDLHLDFGQPLPAADWPQLTLEIGSETFALGRAGGTTPNEAGGSFWWREANNPEVMEQGTDVTVKLIRVPNQPAIGEPTITGTAHLGQTLTAGVDTINDPNGLGTFPDDYRFQWIRVDADGTSNATNITNALLSTYTLTTDDLNRKIQVRVSFRDAIGYAEERTSTVFPAIDTIEPPPPAHCDPEDTAEFWCITIVVGNYYSEIFDSWYVNNEYFEDVELESERERGYRRQHCVHRLGTPDAATPQARSRGDHCYGVIHDDDFVIGEKTYTIEGLYWFPKKQVLHLDFTSAIDQDTFDATFHDKTLIVNGTNFEVRNAVLSSASTSTIAWPNASLQGDEGWAVDDFAMVVFTQQSASSQQAAAPTVSGAPTVSAAGTDGRWTEGETVEVTLSFNEAVIVDTTGGKPSLELLLGGTASRRAAYQRGSGSPDLVFGYTLGADDGAHTTMLVTANSLVLGGGAIRSQATQAAAVLEHNGAGVQGRTGRHASSSPAAQFGALPAQHDGATAFTVELRFGDAPAGLDAKRDAALVLEVTGGSVTKSRATGKGSNPPWEVTITPSQAGDITIALPVRACGETHAVCIGGQPLAKEVAVTVPGVPLTARIVAAPTEHDGAGVEFIIEFAFIDHEPQGLSYRSVHNGLFAVTNATIKRASRKTKGSNVGWVLQVIPDGNDDVTIDAHATTDCSAAHAVCDSAGRKFDGELSQTVQGPARLSVADATVEEADGATLDFVVSLSRDATRAVSVDVETSDGTATAGEDYEAHSGTVSFAVGEREKTVSITVKDDAHDEGSETMTLGLSNPSGAVIDDGTATGTITNDDPIPQAWLARFGRTVAEQGLDAVRDRLSADRTPGFRGRLAGEALPSVTWTDPAREADPATDAQDADTADAGTADDGDSMAIPEFTEGERRAFLALLAPGTGEGDRADMPEGRAPSAEEAMLGTAFEIARETGGGLSLAFWGRAARSGFSGRDGEIALDGDVATAMLGTDWTRRDALFGLLLFRSRGEGGYAGPDGSGGGGIEADLAGLVPWAGRRKDGSPTLWAAAGTGRGEMTLTPEGVEKAFVSGLGWSMAAAGADGAPERSRRSAERNSAGARTRSGPGRRRRRPSVPGACSRRPRGRPRGCGSGWRRRGAARSPRGRRWRRGWRPAFAMTGATRRPGSGWRPAAASGSKTGGPAFPSPSTAVRWRCTRTGISRTGGWRSRSNGTRARRRVSAPR